MYKRYGKRWISVAFIIIFCLTGISADFHQSYAFLSCVSASETEAFFEDAPGREAYLDCVSVSKTGAFFEDAPGRDAYLDCVSVSETATFFKDAPVSDAFLDCVSASEIDTFFGDAPGWDAYLDCVSASETEAFFKDAPVSDTFLDGASAIGADTFLEHTAAQPSDAEGLRAVPHKQAAAHAAGYRAAHSPLPEYVLLSERRTGRVHYRFKNRESGRISLSRVKTLHLDLPRGLCGCGLFTAASHCVLDRRTSSEETAITYIHNKDGKKASLFSHNDRLD